MKLARTVLAFAGLCLVVLAAWAQEPAGPKYSVKVRDEKAIVTEMDDTGAIDPTKQLNIDGQQFGAGFFINVRTIRNETLHLSHFPMFLINGRQVQPGQGGRFEARKTDLGKTAGGRTRVGYSSVWLIDDLRITQTVELHPTKPKTPGAKRLMSTALVSYVIENKAAKTQTVGARVCMDTFVIDNDGCLFAAPTHPKKVLDGIVLQEKTLPPYVEMLQRPNIENPGYKSVLTLDVGSRYEQINKVVLSGLRAGFGNWDMAAVQAMGDSAISAYWPTKEMKPGSKRELAYAYGEGIAVRVGSEGRFQMALGGSFEPGKTFTISALIADPPPGQSLALELPKGIERLEGKSVQPVVSTGDDQEYSTVLWKARVTEPGEYTIRVRSSTGLTLSKVVTIAPEK